jgi:PAS domain S-box-containing protein
MVDTAHAEASPPVGDAPGGNTNRLIQTLVGRLRERAPGGLREALSGMVDERDRALDREISRDGKKILERYDAIILSALSMRYDSLDAAVVETFAVAEIDGEGLVSYANSAFEQLVPRALGREFAELFGMRAGHVRQAMLSGQRKTLWLDLHRHNLPSVHVRTEIGPLTDEFRRGGAYALLLDVSDEEARFDAAPWGVLRLDLTGAVVFANTRAEEMFGEDREQLAGCPVETLFRVEDAESEQSAIAEWLQCEKGLDVVADLLPMDGRAASPVRMTVIPSFEKGGSRAGTIFTIRPRAKELAQAELNRLMSALDLTAEHLLEGVMKAIQSIVPFEFANFSIYSEDMAYSQMVAMWPYPKWEWTTAWFPLGPGVNEFLLGTKTWGDLREAIANLAPDVADDHVVRNFVERELIKDFITLPVKGGAASVRASLTLLSHESGRYGAKDMEQLVELGVDRLLLIAEASIARRRRRKVRELNAKLVAAPEYHNLAQVLADGIA